MPIVPLTPLATPPDPNDRSTFDARAYPFTVSQQTMVGEFNANVSALNDAATASAAAIAAANYKGAWSTLTGPLAIPATVVHNGNLYMLLESVSNVAAEEPGVSSKWKGLSASPLVRVARTSNTQLTAADSGKWIDVTSGTFTQTFSAAAALGDGWWCYLRNSGTGDITLDPSGAETIDGLASYVMYPGEVRMVQCDGATLRTVVVSPFNKTFTASGSFVKPPGYSVFEALVWSGGNSGQKSGGTGEALGGGGGGCFPARLPASSLSATTAITVGAGGAARATTNTGAFGGDSSIGSLLTVKQGGNHTSGGAVAIGLTPVDSSSTNRAPDFGPVITSGGSNVGALWGGGASSSGNASSGSIYGGGAGGSFSSGSLRTPGASAFGGAGGAAGDAVSGTDGTAPGGGGGGTRTGAQSGAGARGEVRIWGLS